jgi:hypothetical protein
VAASGLREEILLVLELVGIGVRAGGVFLLGHRVSPSQYANWAA